MASIAVLAPAGCRFGYEPLDDAGFLSVGGAAGASGESDNTASLGGFGGSTSSAGGAASSSSTTGSGGAGGAASGGAGGATGTGGATATGGLGGTGGSGAGGTSDAGGTSNAGGAATSTAAGGTATTDGTTTTGDTATTTDTATVTTTGGAGAGGASTGGTGGTGGAPAVGEEPYCERLHHLVAAPVIDGGLDGNLPLQDLTKNAVRVPADNPPGFSSLPNDVSLRFAAAWFDGGFYLYVEAVDPNRYPAITTDDEFMGDGIDIYVDHDAVFDAAPGFFDDPGTRSMAVAAPVDGSTPSTRGSLYMPFVDLGAWTGGEFMAVPTSDGYRIEAVVTAATLGLSSWSPSASVPFAFDFGHNVSFPAGELGSEGRRLGHYFAQAASGADGDFEDYPFYNAAVFCTPILTPP